MADFTSINGYNVKDKIAREAISNLLSKTLTPEDYGAVGDGVTNDSDAIKAMFAEANATKTPVKFDGTKTYVVDAIEQAIEVDTDFNDCCLVLPPSGKVFITEVGEDVTISSANVTATGIANSDVANKSYTILTDLLLGVRYEENYYYQQHMVCNSDGNFINSPWYQDVKSGKTWTLKNVMDLKPNIEIKNVRLKLQSSETFPIFFNITRNNVAVKNVYVEQSIESNTGAELILAKNTSNLLFENISPCNVQRSADTYGYLIGLFGCSDVTIKNINANNGWGVIGTHFVTNVRYEKCNVNRIDNHFGWFGKYLIDDCFISGSHGYISFGFGYGKFTVANSVINRSALSSSNSAIALRADLPPIFDADFLIDNCKIIGNGKDESAFSFSNGVDAPTDLYGGNINITVRNCNIDNFGKLFLSRLNQNLVGNMSIKILDSITNFKGIAYIVDLDAGKVCNELMVSNSTFKSDMAYPQTFIADSKYISIVNCYLPLSPYNNFGGSEIVTIKGNHITYMTEPPFNPTKLLVIVDNTNVMSLKAFSSTTPSKVINNNTTTGDKTNLASWNNVAE